MNETGTPPAGYSPEHDDERGRFYYVDPEKRPRNCDMCGGGGYIPASCKCKGTGRLGVRYHEPEIMTYQGITESTRGWWAVIGDVARPASQGGWTAVTRLGRFDSEADAVNAAREAWRAAA